MRVRLLPWCSIAVSAALPLAAQSLRRSAAVVPEPYPLSFNSVPHVNSGRACDQLQVIIPKVLANREYEPLYLTSIITQLVSEGDNPTTQQLFDGIPAEIKQTWRANIDGAMASLMDWTRTKVMSDSGYGEADAVQRDAGGLPAFCRFGANIVTSEMSGVWFEAWLPLPPHAGGNSSVTDTSFMTSSSSRMLEVSIEPEADSPPVKASSAGWRGRLVFMGNSGQSGSPNYPEMKQVLTRYREAAASSNAGHFGASSLSNWTIGNVPAQIDFGHRGVHVASVASQAVVKHFYGVLDRKGNDGKRRVGFPLYYKGCSTGGRQGMAEAQRYPEDYDGILAGSPAIYYNGLNAYQIHVNSFQADRTSPRYIPQSLYPVIHKHIIDQCDLNDGVKDAVIEDPERCDPKLDELLCHPHATSQRRDVCLTAEQLANLEDIYTSLRYPNGSIIHESVLYGSEFSWTITDGVVGKPYPPAPGWYQYQVLNETTSSDSFDPYQVVEGNFSLIELAQRLDPGGTNTEDPDLSAYFSRGSKLLHYHGLADQLIPPGSSDRYFKEVQEHMQKQGSDDLSDSYRYFRIPGMAHCRGGDGAWNFGGPSQVATSGSRPLRYDSHHDAFLALIQWVESAESPDYLIGAAYKNSTSDDPDFIGDSSNLTPFSNGVKFSHTFCPFPQSAVLQNPDEPYKASSLTCQ